MAQHQGRTAPAAGGGRLCNVLVLAVFASILLYCAYDGFKEIFTSPELAKPKEAGDSIAELKASIERAKVDGSMLVRKRERRSALSAEPSLPPPPAERQYIAQGDPPAVSMVILLSAIQQQPCAAEGGDELHWLSVRNKQDYARLHGIEFVMGMEQADPQLENMWNKPAWISKVLEEQRSDWVLWVDADTVILDANFSLPYHEYAAQAKDLVIYGNRTEVEAGHPIKGVNTGVMLIHNTPWARHLFAQVNVLGRLDGAHTGDASLSAIFLKELQADGYSDGLRDQNAVNYLLKTHPEWHERVAFVDKEVCLNCYWRDLVGVTGFATPDFERQENVSFIQHFMGCQTCSALNRNGDLATCRDAMIHSFRHAEERQRPMLAHTPPRDEAQLTQLRRLPFCSFNTDADGCAGAEPRARPPPAAPAAEPRDWESIDSAVIAQAKQQQQQQQAHQEQQQQQSIDSDPAASEQPAAAARASKPAFERSRRRVRARVEQTAARTSS